MHHTSSIIWKNKNNSFFLNWTFLFSSFVLVFFIRFFLWQISYFSFCHCPWVSWIKKMLFDFEKDTTWNNHLYLCLSLLYHDAFSLLAQHPWSDLFWGVLLAIGLWSPQFPLLKNNLLPPKLYFNIPFLAIAPFPFSSGFGVSSSSFFWSIFIHGWN